MNYLRTDFQKTHQSPLNCILHVITTGIGLSAACYITDCIYLNASIIGVLFYVVWLFDKIHFLLWSVSFTYMMICYLCRSWFTTITCFPGIIAGYVLQDAAHYYTGEETLLSTYKNEPDAFRKLIDHTIYLVPLLLDQILNLLSGVAAFFTPNRNVIQGKINSVDIDDINDWVLAQHPTKDHTTHWWYDDLSKSVQRKFERIARSSDMESAYRKLYSEDTWHLERVSGMDEIYVAAYKHSQNSDTVFFTPHIDGPFGLFPFCTVFRTLVAVNPNEYICTKFPTNGDAFTLDKGDLLGFDFNRKVHYIEAHKDVVAQDYRIVLKVHHIVGPRVLYPLIQLLSSLTTLYDKIAREAFLKTLVPKTWFEKALARFILLCTDGYRELELRCGLSNITWLLFSLCISTFGYDWFLLLTSFVHYTRYFSTFYLRKDIAYEEFKRDCFFWKAVALGQLMLLYSPSIWSFLLICIGFGLSGLAFLQIGTDATYFGTELNKISNCRSASFPYGTIPHPMIIGSCIGIWGIGCGLESQYTWIIWTHIVLYVCHGLQEQFNIHV